MDNKTYNEYLTSLFQNCSIQLYLKENNKSFEFRRNVQEMFIKLADVYNNTIAVQFLEDLKFKSPTITEKLKNYPEMFWKTDDASKEIKDGLTNLVRTYLLDIYEEDKISQNYDKNKKAQYIDKTMTKETDLLIELKKTGIELAERKSDIYEIVSIIKPALQELAYMRKEYIEFEPEEMLYKLITMNKIMDGPNAANISVDQNKLNKILVEQMKTIFEKINKNNPKENQSPSI